MEPVLSQTPVPIIGEWKLISFEIQTAQSGTIYPFGENAQGTIMYTVSGRFFGQVTRRGRPAFASGDLMKATSKEMHASYKGCNAYYGRYKFDADNGVIIHYVEDSLFPNWIDTLQRRFFELSGNRLKLQTPPMPWGGDEVTVVLLFERIV